MKYDFFFLMKDPFMAYVTLPPLPRIVQNFLPNTLRGPCLKICKYFCTQFEGSLHPPPRQIC